MLDDADTARLHKWFNALPLPEPGPAPEHLLEVRGLGFGYTKGQSTLHDISFSIGKGEMVSIVGRNGAGMPRDWLPNDGLGNTISARYPGGAPHADFVPGQTPVRGVWQVLPVEHLDHLAAIGGVMNNGVVRTRLFYRRVMALLDAAAAADANS